MAIRKDVIQSGIYSFAAADQDGVKSLTQQISDLAIVRGSLTDGSLNIGFNNTTGTDLFIDYIMLSIFGNTLATPSLALIVDNSDTSSMGINISGGLLNSNSRFVARREIGLPWYQGKNAYLDGTISNVSISEVSMFIVCKPTLVNQIFLPPFEV